MDEYHISVLLNESIEALCVRKGEKYIDCNLGGGGHTAEILARGGKVLATDLDSDAIKHCKDKFKKEILEKSLFLFKENFTKIKDLAREIGWDKEEIAGIIYDLGLSTFQIKKSHRGFSFDEDAQLDMRFDSSSGVTAIDLINVLSEKELAQMIKEYGEDPQYKQFAKTLKSAVAKYGLHLTAKQLAQLIGDDSRYAYSRNNKATRVFQALRIMVNSELKSLEESFGRAVEILKPGGRLVVISFHSLEDKIAKNLAILPALRQINKKPTIPSREEIARNNSARSAKMRIYEKI